MMLSDPGNKKLAEIVLAVSVPLRRWHQHQNVELRSTEGTEKWLRAQIGGGYMKHCEQIIGRLYSHEALSNCGFSLPASARDLEHPQHNMELVVDDDFANTFGSLCLSLLGCRCKRGLSMLESYPTRLTLLLEGGDIAQQTVDEFRKHHSIWEEFESYDDKSSHGRLIQSRSLFATTPVRQFVEAFKDVGWHPHPDIGLLLTKRSRALIGTQVVEDLINSQKNAGNGQHVSKYRKPETSMSWGIAQQVVDSKHKFLPMTLQHKLPGKSQRFPGWSEHQPCPWMPLSFGALVAGWCVGGARPPTAGRWFAGLRELGVLAS